MQVPLPRAEGNRDIDHIGVARPATQEADRAGDRVVQGDDARVLVVGHEPDFSQTVFDFTGGRVDLKKGGVAAVRVDGTRGELIDLLRPRELEEIADDANG